ncbi:dnaJ homolog subfamily C member 16 isoform X1 [Astyanax mexicanus]|uniref:dnaJ homolog subfamily C member 16 isoform X1 n=1 Tax=Astyanax mexicanus TaxID=7994 RepID=UPI0020CB3CC2|nr:dnaJ homolog subfamily C member 16 isoform X1 [Astyanax mexicanus]
MAVRAMLVYLLVLLELLVSVVGNAAQFDPYKTLGVTRSASQTEIKKVYKRLAKEWHPDKNKNPEAEDMFIKITKSYEILSSEEKRANYDRYGQTDDTQPYGHGHRGFRHFHDNFYFDESFFNFPFNSKSGRDSADSKYTLHFNQYINDVLPETFKRPYLIKITSDWCFSCIHIEPVWKEAVQELEPLGVGIGVVDVGYERRLANHLGAHRTPSILGVINGKVTFFHYAVVKEHLVQFVEDLLPQRLVEKVTDRNDRDFLKSWHDVNKPHVLLFDQVPVVPLLYKLTAFSYKDYVQFGYVDQGLSETADLLKQYNINTYAPTMLVFKENTDKPADIIQAKGMKKQIIDEFISNNKFLLAPRLVNQKVFDELCPVKQFHRRRKYCVLLITGDEDAFVPGNKAFLSLASANTNEVLRFTYVYQRQQQPLCSVLLKNRDSIPPQVVILERRNGAGKVIYKPVLGGWNGSEEDKHRLLEELEHLQKDPSILNHDAMLPQLNNEFASMFLIRWIYTAYDYLSEIADDLLHNNWREMMPLLSLIFSALFILFGTVVIQAFSDSSEEKQTKPKTKESTKTENGSPNTTNTSSSRPPKKNFVEVTELTDITYTSNLVKLRPGHINVVLVLTDATKNILLSKFAKEVYSFTGSPTLHFSFLNVDKHSEWMSTLLEYAQDAMQIDMDEEDSGGRKMDYTGYVLALNGHKKYLCLFKPVYTGEDPDGRSEEDAGTSTSRPRSGSKDEHQHRKSSARSRSTTLQIHHKLDRLGLWMERLMEGTLPRYYIPAWPGLDKITVSK